MLLHWRGSTGATGYVCLPPSPAMLGISVDHLTLAYSITSPNLKVVFL
jgi:hypothetical protein